MKKCGRCGTQNLDVQALCAGCGDSLPEATGGGGTLVIDAPSPDAPPAAPPARGLGLKGTMIGMAPPSSFPAPPSAPPAPPAPAANFGPRFGSTMLGIAPLAPTGSNQAPGLTPPSAGGSRIASAQKTMLGVARPGIAPLNPGQAKTPSQPPVKDPQPPATPAPPLSAASTPPAKARAPARSAALMAALAIGASALLLVAAALAFFLVKGRGSVTAKASLDDTGRELVELTCAECADGTKAWSDASQTTFQGGKAKLQLMSPLKVGENPLVLGIERPSRRREEIAISIPVEYRVRGSTDELSQPSPKLSVIASALPGTALFVDGKPVSSSPNGPIRFDFEVEREVSGPEATVKTLERRVPYNVTPLGGTAQTGEVRVRIGITPMVVDAPGEKLVVKARELVIAGRTAPGAVLLVGSEEVVLDAAGRFVKKQALELGDNSIVLRATLREHAPRLVTVLVRRSDDLAREGALARSMANATYAEVLRAAEAAIGRTVAFQGTLFDMRRDGYSSVILLDVTDGCRQAPCLAKVIYGAESNAAKGSDLRAFGKVIRFVDGARSGQRIPEIRAELLIAGGS